MISGGLGPPSVSNADYGVCDLGFVTSTNFVDHQLAIINFIALKFFRAYLILKPLILFKVIILLSGMA